MGSTTTPSFVLIFGWWSYSNLLCLETDTTILIWILISQYAIWNLIFEVGNGSSSTCDPWSTSTLANDGQRQHPGPRLTHGTVLLEFLQNLSRAQALSRQSFHILSVHLQERHVLDELLLRLPQLLFDLQGQRKNQLTRGKRVKYKEATSEIWSRAQHQTPHRHTKLEGIYLFFLFERKMNIYLFSQPVCTMPLRNLRNQLSFWKSKMH